MRWTKKEINGEKADKEKRKCWKIEVGKTGIFLTHFTVHYAEILKV